MGLRMIVSGAGRQTPCAPHPSTSAWLIPRESPMRSRKALSGPIGVATQAGPAKGWERPSAPLTRVLGRRPRRSLGFLTQTGIGKPIDREKEVIQLDWLAKLHSEMAKC